MSIKQIGLVAGRGRYPLLFAEEARRHGVERLVAVAIRDDADPAIEELADEVNRLPVGKLGKIIKTFVRAGVKEVVFAGQITPGRLFKGLQPDLRLIKVLAGLRQKNADTIFGALANEFESDGIHVLPATTFMEDHLASKGTMGKVKPGKKVMADIEYGREIAAAVSRMDIGQTVVVKNGTVLAVEAFEGTDQAIRRGGELGHGDVVIVKLPKETHDVRFDIPCVGTKTVESLISAEAAAIAVEAGRTLFIDRPELVAALDRAKIAAFGFTNAE